MVELGKITKPETEIYSNKRKLYCIANVYTIEDAPEDFKKLVDTYWDQVTGQLEKIEAAGKVKKIFCETIYQGGEEALEILSKLNERVAQLVRKKLDEGGILLPLEKKEILGPFSDWGNCLRVVFTQEVFEKVFEFYREYSEKRIRHILDTIEANLSEAEAGLLIMKDEDRAKLQFPNDIEVFLITPPSYDDIMRWLRNKLAEKPKDEE